MFQDNKLIYLLKNTTQSILEFATNESEKEDFNEKLKEAFDENDITKIEVCLIMCEVFQESKIYYEKILKPAFNLLDKIKNNIKNTKV